MKTDYRDRECGYKVSKDSPRCSLPPSAHGVEFQRVPAWMARGNCQTAHPFQITEIKVSNAEA